MEELRTAFMTGYTRYTPWETAIRIGKVKDTPENRSAFMAGYTRYTPWEIYTKTLEA
jgi:hypothetical protein